MARRKRVAIGPRTAGRKRGRRSKLSRFTVIDLQNELHRRQNVLQGLMAQRQRISEQLRMLDSQIEAEGGSVIDAGREFGRRRRGGSTRAGRAMGMATPKHARRGPGRPRGGLVQSLHKVLTGTQMSVANVCEAVKKAGYQTTSPNFRTIVNAALLANPGMFKKVERGVYTAK